MKRRPTIIDVAGVAGVSKSTVSRVVGGDGVGVADDKKIRVLRAVEQLGYVRNEVASSLRTERTRMIMLAIPDINNPIWAETARGVQDVMDGDGYDVVFANSDWNERREEAFLRKVRQSRFDGLLINPVRAGSEDLLAVGIPTVILGGLDAYPQFDAVGSDSYSSARESLGHLISLRHTRIGLIMGNRYPGPASIRLSSFLDYLQEAGIQKDDDLIVNVPYTVAGGADGFRRLAKLKPPPTAIFCDNDLVAIGALEAARRAGTKVPDDLSIVSVDDIFAASIVTPPLTTVSKPKYEIGRQAAELLLERIKGTSKGGPLKVALPCTLVIRGSTAELPQT
jgi:DNA-binding LacI/PurR family transcriptional regulator